MNTKIANWFLNSDEKFLAAVRDERERVKYLHQLYQTRIRYFFILLFLIALIFIFGIWAPDHSGTTLPFLLILQALAYLETDSKMRAIKLYELISMTDKKTQ